MYVCLALASMFFLRKQLAPINSDTSFFFFLSAFNSAMEEIRQLKTIFLLKVCSVVTF